MAMIAIRVPPDTAKLLSTIAGALPGDVQAASEMHITLVYLGDDVPMPVLASAMAACHSVTSKMAPFILSVDEISSFEPNSKSSTPVILPIRSNEIHELRRAIVDELDRAGVPYSKKWPDFKPHVTLSYIPGMKAAGPLPSPISWGAFDVTIYGANHGDGRVSIVLPFELQEVKINMQKISSKIQRIASKVANTQSNLFNIASELRVADAKSLARSIRDEAWNRILGMFPSGTWDTSIGNGSGMYDTNEQGKGWRDGYVSFGVKPTVWSNAGLIGGILFRFSYSSEGVIPKKGTPEYEGWVKGGPLGTGEVAEVGSLSGGYYNKQPGGSVETFSAEGGSSRSDVLFGEAMFEVDGKEAITAWEWADPDGMKSRIQKVIDDTLAHPPTGALSKDKKKQQKLNPYTSVTKLINLLIKERRNVFYADEVALVSQAMEVPRNTVIESLRKRSFSYDPGNAPFPLKQVSSP